VPIERRITRRAFGGFIWCARLSLPVRAASATAFGLIGDEHHNPAYIRAGLTRTLGQGAGLSIDFTDEVTRLSYETLRQYKILIMFRDGYDWPNGYWRPVISNEKVVDSQDKLVSVPPVRKIGGNPVSWITVEQGKAIKHWVMEGGSLFAYHNNSQVSLFNKDYDSSEEIVGGFRLW
jgi:hypothetical protein